MTRPRGKALPKSSQAALAFQYYEHTGIVSPVYVGVRHSTSFGPGADIKTEAWVLRRLVSVFGQVTRRPHIPRDPQMKHLFTLVGIDVTRSSNESPEDGEPSGLEICNDLDLYC